MRKSVYLMQIDGGTNLLAVRQPLNTLKLHVQGNERAFLDSVLNTSVSVFEDPSLQVVTQEAVPEEATNAGEAAAKADADAVKAEDLAEKAEEKVTARGTRD